MNYFELANIGESHMQDAGKPIVERVNVDGEEMKAFVFKDKNLMSPGVWNGVRGKYYYSPDEMKKAFENTDWTDMHNLHLYADHIDKSTAAWIGYVRNHHLSGNDLKGDLVIVDEDYAKKLVFGAKFGVSPKFSGRGENGAVKDAVYRNFSVVVDPACKTTFLNKEGEEMDDFENAELSRASINDLPDSAFAYIESGGKKDEDGKTIPRSLRHLPYKSSSGGIDLPHLRNALARLKQTHISSGAKTSALGKLRAAAKSVGMKVTTELSEDYSLKSEGEMTEKEKIDEQSKETAKEKEPDVEKKTEVSEIVSKLSELTKGVKEDASALKDLRAKEEERIKVQEKEEEEKKEEEKPPEGEKKPEDEPEKPAESNEEKKEEKLAEQPTGEPSRQSVKDSEVAPSEGAGRGSQFLNADVGMLKYLQAFDASTNQTGKSSESFDLSMEPSDDYPWMTFELASTVTSASNTRGSSITAGYLLEPINWAKAVIDGGKNQLFFANVVRQATIPNNVRDYVMPKRKMYEDTWESSSEEYAAGSEVAWTVLDNMEGVQFTPTRYNYGVAVSNKTLRSNAIDLMRYAREELAYKWANDVDAAIATALAAGTSSADGAPGVIDLFGGDATSTTTLTAGDVIDTEMISEGVTLLENSTNYYWTGGTFTKDDTGKNPWYNETNAPFVLFIGAKQKQAFLDDSQFTNASEYGSNEILLNGEIGNYLGTKVVVSNNTPASATFGVGGDIDGHQPLLVKSQYCGGIAWAQKPSIKAFDWPNADQKRIVMNFEYDVEVLQPDSIILMNVTDD